MCGRYATFTRLDDVAALFSLDVISPEVAERGRSWNVAPTTSVPIIVEKYDDDDHLVRAAHLAKWGLIPPWAKDPSIGARMINARSETVAEKKSFAPSLAKRRCVVVADGYYEWLTSPDGKQPYYISRPDGQPLAFAGLYSWWKDGEEWVLSTTIITQDANPELAFIHDRTPHVLEVADLAEWLDPRATDPVAALDVLARPNPELQAWAVRREVGRVGVNEPANVEPV